MGFALWLPWSLTHRDTMFMTYMLESMPFATLAAGRALASLARPVERRVAASLHVALAAAWLVAVYPMLNAQPVPLARYVSLMWLPRWEAGEPMPAVMLLDINLPRMTGLEVLQAFKRHELARRIPVVVLTSSRDDRDLGKAYDLGVNSYIEKPVSFNKFIEVAGHIELYWCVFNERPYRP